MPLCCGKRSGILPVWLLCSRRVCLCQVRNAALESEGAELRAQLAATAEALDKHMEQFSRSKESAHTVVPDVYRKAMVSILRTVPTVPEPSNLMLPVGGLLLALSRRRQLVGQ